MIAIIAALLIIGGGIAVYLVTQGGDDDDIADDPTPTDTSETTSEPTSESPTTEATTETTTEATTDGVTNYPTFSGETPTEQEYLDLATNFVNLAKSGDCAGARTLMQKQLSNTTSDSELCEGEHADMMNKADLTDYDFKDFTTAGAYMDFINNGVTVSVGMRFASGEMFVDNLFVY